jgi:[CysO sulfur-carrier protein]-thiocarboxylate-dependent cysteine synthase
VAVHGSVLSLIGDTPIVDVSALSPNPRVRILAKLEGANPGGSVKDRVAQAMIAKAEADGELWPGRRILEPSSGNTGIGLALIARLRGYPVTIVLPDNVSVERRQLLELYGAELILTPGDEGSNGAVRRAEQLAAEHPEWAFLYQYGNEANPQAHYDGTGPEILRDVPDITHFVAGLGTSGTLLGVGTYLKERQPDLQVFAVEPPAGERVEGLRSLDDGFVPPIFEKWGGDELLDGRRVVRPRESIEWARRLVTEAGLFVGVSGGAAMAGAVKLAERLGEAGGVIVFVVPDDGWKYLSTGAYTDPIDDVVARADRLSFW